MTVFTVILPEITNGFEELVIILLITKFYLELKKRLKFGLYMLHWLVITLVIHAQNNATVQPVVYHAMQVFLELLHPMDKVNVHVSIIILMMDLMEIV